MEILEWIQDWFKTNCDGDWEKDEVIQITTLAAPGWEVEIDISRTSRNKVDSQRNKPTRLVWS